MKTITFITLSFILCFSAFGEDKDAKKGVAWKNWQKFYEHVIKGEAGKAREMLEGRLLQDVGRRGIDALAKELQKHKVNFVREFKGDENNKDKIYLVVKVNNNNSVIAMQLKDKIWKIIVIDQLDPKGPEDMKNARGKVELSMVKSNLKNIGTTYAAYFADGTSINIVSPKKTDVDPAIMKYIHPETGKVHKFLFVRGGTYEGSHRRLLAVTDVKIFGKYWAAYGDGHVATVSDAGFEKYKVAFGIKPQKLEKVELSKEEQEGILAEIKILGAGKYKERKAAKAKLMKRGEGVVYFLKQNLKQDDFEVVVALKEIIKELTPKAFKGRRPEL